jgi:hypothetical protein
VIEKPRWLEDEPEIAGLLHTFIDKFDRKPAEEWKQPPELKLTATCCPKLFRQDEEADRSWELLKQLDVAGCLVIITNSKRAPFDPEYKNARLLFNLDFEETLRQWFQRPRRASMLAGWQSVVAQCAHHFPGDVSMLRSRLITLPGRSSSEVIAGFVAIAQYQSQQLTLTQLSARCFWGQSKFLDGREELIVALYPDIQLTPRPIIINVHLPAQIDGVLLIENQDSYCSAIHGRPDAACNMALVYCAGFRGSAQRIRNRKGVSFHYQGDCSRQDEFEAWWLSEMWSGPAIYFWGDLDYSGMAILKALRQRFEVIEAWQAGYEPLLQQLHEGNGHTPLQGNKEEQCDPQLTGCEYADNTLLPALRAVGLFVDQEMVF